MFSRLNFSTPRFEMPRSDSPSVDSGSSPIPDNDSEEAKIAEVLAAETAQKSEQEDPSSTDTGVTSSSQEEASSSTDTAVTSRSDHSIKAPLARRFFRKFGGSKIKNPKISPLPTLSTFAEKLREHDIFCRGKLETIVVNPDDKRYFIPVSTKEEIEGSPMRYVSVFRDERGYFIKGEYDKLLVMRYFTSAGQEDSESVTQKYFTPDGTQSIESGKTKNYLTLEAARFIQSTTKIHLSNSAKEIEFVSLHTYNLIKVQPAYKGELMISRCFVDPETSPGINSGEVDQSFLLLQKEITESNKDLDPQKVDRFIGAGYENNYPLLINPETKEVIVETKINCDAWWAGFLLGFSISIVADGCGLGQHSREAAQRSVGAAKKYICEHLHEHLTLERLTQIVLSAFEKAHLECIEDKFNPRTTTLNVNLSFTSVDGERYLLVVGLGDTKSYLCMGTTEGSPVVIDLSQYEGFNATDCGGALGGFMSIMNERNEREYITPYMNNLSVVCCKLDPTKNYLVLNMSDGVTNNLSPEFFGLSPSEVNFVIAAYDPDLKWEQIKRPGLRHKILTKFANERLAEILSGCTFSAEESVDEICNKIIKHCSEMTLATREFMEKNVKSRQPETSKEYPGKMDHTTAVGFKILSTVSSSSAIHSSSSSCSSSSSPIVGN